MSANIAISRDTGVQVLRLDRPEKKNALDTAMYCALCDAIEAGDAADDVAVHVLFGTGGVFTAGNDISDFLATSLGKGGPVDVLRFIRLLPKVKKPLIAGVDGVAVGIGTTLLFHCDLVYASPAARFSTPFLDLGLVPEAASSLLFPRMMGYARAFELLVLGNVFDATRAREAGFVNEVIPADLLEAKVMEVARRLAAKPPEALTMSRRLLRGDASDIVQRVDEEAQLFGRRLSSPEAREAFTAFTEKRAPDFAKLSKGG
jgi:enoyl-CoA hydratase/carnithine racemase